MKKLIFLLVLLATVVFVGLNSSMIADQSLAWVKDHPKSDTAPEILYRSARWCDFLGDNAKAMDMYWELYQRYPDRGDLCAPALYHLADIIVATSTAKQRAKTYLEIVMNQYPTVEDWAMKSKQLYDQLTYAH